MLPLTLLMTFFFSKTPRFTRRDTCLEKGEQGQLSILMKKLDEQAQQEDSERDVSRIPSLASLSQARKSSLGEEHGPRTKYQVAEGKKHMNPPSTLVSEGSVGFFSARSSCSPKSREAVPPPPLEVTAVCVSPGVCLSPFHGTATN